MSINKYRLVNPIIKGTFTDTYEADTTINAAEKMWKGLSKHIVGHVPNFIFTLRELSTGSDNHFRVRENRETSNYQISEIKLKQNI